MDRALRRATRASFALVAACCALTVVSAASATAQDFRGAITGRVIDSSGARLPGATITATNVATNVGSTTVANNDGSYTIPYLTAGNYTVVAELSGFKTLVRENLQVHVGDRLTLDLTLDVGQLEETVTVTAQSPLLGQHRPADLRHQRVLFP
jgi:hypothetical protein